MPLLRIDDLWRPDSPIMCPRRIDDVKRKFVFYSEVRRSGQTLQQKILYQDFLHWIIRNKAAVERREVSEEIPEAWSPSLVLGRKIARVRKEHGMTQEDLARILDVSRSAVALMETGRSCHARRNISKLIDIFELEPEFFLGDGKGDEMAKISEDEQTLLQMYRTLSIAGRIDAQQYMERRTKEG